MSDDSLPRTHGASARLAASLMTNPFWTLVVLAGGTFVVTCLATVAATMGDPQGPMNRLVTAYGTAAISAEAGVLIVSGLLAMMLDRLQTLRRSGLQSEADANRQDPHET